MQKRRDGFSILTEKKRVKTMPDRERKRVPDHRSDTLKGSLPHGPRSSCPPQEHEISEYPRLSEESEKESRDEATQRGMEELYCASNVKVQSSA